ncbi:hypothetical protein D9758_007204 [Tetrapyrgos nigripes]|uniref:Peptidase M50B-like-domain-containing protein n=1 Tax=Tetrapyrgos nigripes TaxID=182062 RepID=A0A8H5D0Y4_9AGAR|nr:hypothetical protein D9758_007204 [Tetrapyrgos nigripes]
MSVSRPPLAPPTATSTPGSPIRPTDDQIVVLYVIIATSVVIFGFWNVPGIRNIINPLKLLTIGIHEFSHIIMALFTGGRILRITIDPHVGGATIVEGGIPTLILSAGYIGSSLFGGLFVLAGWDILVAKVMSFVIALGLIMPLTLVRDKLTILLTVLYEGLLIGFWFIDHGSALRWYCLVIGVMNTLFVVWDFADDRFFHKINDSDATQFSLLYPSMGPHDFNSNSPLTFTSGRFSVLGILAFKRTPDEIEILAYKMINHSQAINDVIEDGSIYTMLHDGRQDGQRVARYVGRNLTVRWVLRRERPIREGLGSLQAMIDEWTNDLRLSMT